MITGKLNVDVKMIAFLDRSLHHPPFSDVHAYFLSFYLLLVPKHLATIDVPFSTSKLLAIQTLTSLSLSPTTASSSLLRQASSRSRSWAS